MLDNKGVAWAHLGQVNVYVNEYEYRSAQYIGVYRLIDVAYDDRYYIYDITFMIYFAFSNEMQKSCSETISLYCLKV